MSGLKEIAITLAEGGTFLFAGAFVSKGLSAISTIFIARFLSSEEYGIYAIVQIVPSFLLIFTDWGIDTALVKYIAHNKVRRKKSEIWSLAKAGILFKLVVGFVLSFTFFLFSNQIALILNRPEIGTYVRLSSFLVITQALFSTTGSILVGADRIDLGSSLMVVESIARVGLVSVLLLWGYGVYGALAAIVTSFTIGAIVGAILIIAFLRSLTPASTPSNTGLWRLMLSYGWPIFLGSLIMGLIVQYTQFLLPWFASDMEIGNYRVAVNSSMIVMMINWSITTPLFPAMSKLNHNNDREKMKILFTSSIKYSALLVVPATLAIVVIAKELVFTLFGSRYTLAPAFLSMYALLHMYVLLGSLSIGNFLQSQGDTRAWLRINLIYASIAIPLSFFFIQLWGILGLILALIVSSAPSHGYGLILVYRKYGLHPDWYPLIKIFFASLLSAGATYCTFLIIPVMSELPQLLISIVIFALFYLMFTPLTGAISLKDLDDLSTVTSRMKPIYSIAGPLLRFEEKLLKLKDGWKLGS